MKRRFAGRRTGTSVLLILALTLLAFVLAGAQAASSQPNGASSASGWVFYKLPQGQPACTGVAWAATAGYFDRLDCGFAEVMVSETAAGDAVKVGLFAAGGAQIGAALTTTRQTDDGAWRFNVAPAASWPAGPITARVIEVTKGSATPLTGNFGETTFYLNQLGATVAATGSGFTPGDPVPVTGTIFELDEVPPLAAAQKTNVGGAFKLRVVAPNGTVRGTYGPFTASDTPGSSRGTFSATLPAAATAGLTATADSNFKVTLAIEVVDATYADLATGDWAGTRAGAGSVTVSAPPSTLVLENSFVSAVGWVKPGDSYPFRLFVKNYRSTPETNALVKVPAVDGTTFVNAIAATGSGTCSISGGVITWTIGAVAAAGPAGPAIKTCVVEAKADTLGQDPQIVWKNLSTKATLTYNGGASQATESHGPKVIPQRSTFDTARYGDRPFPVVPVDFFDRKHDAAHTGDGLSAKINSPSLPGSTFNLFQENSYGQLYPHGTVPSSGIGSAGFNGTFAFTELQPQGTCHGATFKDVAGTPAYAERIQDGWYQLPGNTDYYGDDRYGTALVGALAGVGAVFAIDDACGPTGKAVYDAAHIADPEIDYSDYDTDKDGVVDFFMMVFTGVGGHGASQTSVPPYDNIWPHSSSLEFYYSDPATGLKGYISQDQLKDLEGRPLYYENASRNTMTTATTAYPVYVRVGPYNVNPESAIDNASVISHEYGHSLGLPDFYSTGARETYGDWNLMATDKSQNMDVFSKQELGWLVPRVLEPGTTNVSNWQDSKLNTHRIDWVDPSGNPYTLTGDSVDNGEGYVAKLPGRQIFDPAKFDAAGPGEGASPDHAWWSQSGNDFGCTPQGGHNLDIFLPELATLPAGTDVRVTFKSMWDIEWDYDYGFVMVSTDGGENYTALPSANGYTTPQGQNPTANSCQGSFGNGITGTSGSYESGTQEVDRVLGSYPDGGFLSDEYDLSSFAGESTVLRFSYSSDPGLARPGWFIDDLKITVNGDVLYETDFESSGTPDDARVFSGGCKSQLRTAATCTKGWQYVAASAGSPADHAYYMEMRDRSGFDFDGKGENDRDAISFLPGMLLVYTNESHCYGNAGCDDPPGQSPLDSQPQPGNSTPNLHDAAFTAAVGDSHFSDSGAGHTDNYEDPSSADGLWHFQFDCLTFDVTSMSGNGIGPDVVPPFDLTGNVTFDLGEGCAPFDYGVEHVDVPNVAPVAVAQARPTTVQVFEPVDFDGSASTDDKPVSELTYEWDFDGDGTFDAVGETQTSFYDTAGAYEATLRVTDARRARRHRHDHDHRDRRGRRRRVPEGARERQDRRACEPEGRGQVRLRGQARQEQGQGQDEVRDLQG